MNDQKTTTKIPFLWFADEISPEISVANTVEENNIAIDKAFNKLRELIKEETEKLNVE